MNKIFLVLLFVLVVAICLLMDHRQVRRGGAQMQNMIQLPVNEPWLTLIKQGVKTIEGRAGAAHKFEQWIGKPVKFFSRANIVMVDVIDVRHYDTIYEYLDAEGWQNVAPHLSSYDATVNEYHKFYSDDKIRAMGGMNAIQINLKI